jgi:hypothetical protein
MQRFYSVSHDYALSKKSKYPIVKLIVRVEAIKIFDVFKVNIDYSDSIERICREFRGKLRFVRWFGSDCFEYWTFPKNIDVQTLNYKLAEFFYI